MLSCIIGSKSINSFDYDEAKLREWSNKEILKCPECNERVIYCNGDYKIPYFKHEVGSECSGNSYYEPMTEEHINGIKILYNRLKEIEGVESLEVEKYIKNTKQRPDIYFEYEGKRYCIEYQCSPISTQYNKRRELYELEGIKDIWILGTEKYAFEKFSESDTQISFNEKRIKAIEDEIDRGNMPLLYLKDDNIYKVDKDGFKPISRWCSRYEIFKENILKTKVKVYLEKYKLESMGVSELIFKSNKNIDEIIAQTNDVIFEVENICRNILDRYSKNIKFIYNLDNDRFPCWKVNTLRNLELYDDQNGEKLLNNLNSYIKLIENIKPYIEDYNNKNNGRYHIRLQGEDLIAKNIEMNYEFSIGAITNIILNYSYYEKKSSNCMDYLEDIKSYIKKEITSDKRKTTIYKKNLVKEMNEVNNKVAISNVVKDLNKENDKLKLIYDENNGVNIVGTKKWVWFNIKDGELDYEHISKAILNKIRSYEVENIILKEIERIEKAVTNLRIVFDITGRVNITVAKPKGKFVKTHIDLSIDCESFDSNALKQVSESISDEIRRVKYGQV